jgi:hypothetical protein
VVHRADAAAWVPGGRTGPGSPRTLPRSAPEPEGARATRACSMSSRASDGSLLDRSLQGSARDRKIVGRTRVRVRIITLCAAHRDDCGNDASGKRRDIDLGHKPRRIALLLFHAQTVRLERGQPVVDGDRKAPRRHGDRRAPRRHGDRRATWRSQSAKETWRSQSATETWRSQSATETWRSQSATETWRSPWGTPGAGARRRPPSVPTWYERRPSHVWPHGLVPWATQRSGRSTATTAASLSAPAIRVGSLFTHELYNQDGGSHES